MGRERIRKVALVTIWILAVAAAVIFRHVARLTANLKLSVRKDVGDRRYIAVLNQCDDNTVRKSAEQVGEMLINSTGQNSETIEKIVFAKLQ